MDIVTPLLVTRPRSGTGIPDSIIARRGVAIVALLYLALCRACKELSHMSKIILLVLTAADQELIPKVARKLVQIPATDLWVLHNPSIGLGESDAVKEIDAKIERRLKEARESAAREDYRGADEMKVEANNLKMERDLLVQSEFTKVDAKIRADAYDRVLEPLRVGVQENGTYRTTAFPETVRWDGLFQAMHTLATKRMWEPDFIHGEYSMLSPAQVVKMSILCPKCYSVPKDPDAEKSELNAVTVLAKATKAPNHNARPQYMLARKMAKEKGVWRDKMPTEEMYAAIGFPKTPESAAA